MIDRENDVHAVIITALSVERAAILRYLHSADETAMAGPAFHRAQLDSGAGMYNLVVLSPTGAGNVAAAAATTRAIDVWNPQHIFLAGIAGGIKAKPRKLGDVIVAEQIVG